MRPRHDGLLAHTVLSRPSSFANATPEGVVWPERVVRGCTPGAVAPEVPAQGVEDEAIGKESGISGALRPEAEHGQALEFVDHQAGRPDEAALRSGYPLVRPHRIPFVDALELERLGIDEPPKR